MALISCLNCSKQISEHALSCPNCGFPLSPEKVQIILEQKKEHEFFESLGNGNAQVKKESFGTTRKIRETKCTCKSCGKIWHYGKTDVLNSTADTLSNFGKDMMCCTGCMPALIIPDKKVTDLNKCPNCGSKAIYKEEVIHEI